MKSISGQLEVSETAFVFPCKQADYHIRFFTPLMEVDLCGHATIATFFCLASQMKPTGHQNIILSQKTKAGILPVHIFFDKDDAVKQVMMRQASLTVKSADVSYHDIAYALNVEESCIRDDFPLQRVSTGLYTLPIIVTSFSVLEQMQPDFSRIKSICEQIDVGSFHVLTFDTIDLKSLYHARNFAPFYGVNEDPVTGTANGAVCSYLRNIGYCLDDTVMVEQGDIMGRSGRVHVVFQDDTVLVGGRATIVEECVISI